MNPRFAVEYHKRAGDGKGHLRDPQSSSKEFQFLWSLLFPNLISSSHSSSTSPFQHSGRHLFQSHSMKRNFTVQVPITDQTEPWRQFCTSEEMLNTAKCYHKMSLLFLSFINPPKHSAALSLPAGRTCLCLEQRKVHNCILFSL